MGISQVGNDPRSDAKLEFAIRDIKRTYGHDVYPRKGLIKYGKANNFGTSEVLVSDWGAKAAQLETYVSTNAITHVSSSSGSDTGVVYYEGHTIDSDGNLTFFTDTITLQGQAKTTLPTACARVSRMRYIVSDNFSSNVGAIYIYEDDTLTSGVPDTVTKIHAVMPVGEGATLKCATSFSQYDYFIITEARIGVTRLSGSNGVGEFRIKKRQVGNAFITGWDVDTARDAGAYSESFNPYDIVRPNSDIIMTTVGSTTGLYATGQISGIICTIEGSPI